MVSQILAKNFTWNGEALCQHKLFSALAIFLSKHSNRDAASIYLALKSVIKNGSPDQVKCHCYLDPNGQTTRHLSPLTY